MSVELFQLLLLIIVANGAPILIRELLNNRHNLAVDFGKNLPDDRPIFGASKTWRGIFASLIATAVAAWWLGYGPKIGFLIALYAILGDLLASFIKRRLAIAPSGMAPLLDQVPESLLPALMMMQIFGLAISSVLLLVLIFIFIELTISKVLYHWGIRKRPY